MANILDLFGDPVPEHYGRRGRPQHIPTQENRNKLKMLLALGWGNERIAKAMSLTANTLRKHYLRDLKFRDEQRDRLDAAFAMKVWTQVCDGNVGAMRLWSQFIDKNDAAVGHSSFYSSQRLEEEARTDERPERMGKKALAEEAALSAGEGTEWGSDLKPN